MMQQFLSIFLLQRNTHLYAQWSMYIDINFRQPKLPSLGKSLANMFIYTIQCTNMQQLKTRGRSACTYISKTSRYCHEQKAGWRTIHKE